jgi:hypothetical protein
MPHDDKPAFTERLLVLATRGQRFLLAAEGPFFEEWIARHAGGLFLSTPAPPAALFVYGRASQTFVAEFSSSVPEEILVAMERGTASWRGAHGHEVQRLALGQAPWGMTMPAPWPILAFVWHYLSAWKVLHPRIGVITPSLHRAYETAHDGEHWARDLQILGFTDEQICRIIGEPNSPPDHVPFGAEIGAGPLQGLLLPGATCKGCKVVVGYAHKPECVAKECVQCARPARSAGTRCHDCLKLTARMPPRLPFGSHVEEPHGRPTALSPRCLAWWSRIMGGWLPNRRIITMGYSSSAGWYGVRVWEYLHILAPAIAHLTGDAAGSTFEGEAFGLKLPARPA